MKIVINNTKFDFNIGCRILKLKHEECPFEQLEDIWNDIIPYTFKEIATEIQNLEQRRIAIGCLGLDRMRDEINPKLVDEVTFDKQTIWVNEKGELENVKFKDTYKLYEVSGDVWAEGVKDNHWAKKVYFVEFKDTSTDRRYMIWVNKGSVYRANNTSGWFNEDNCDITATEAIAWTIQTDIEEGGIDKIVRQGDCILIKKKQNANKGQVRHLTAKEYRELLVLES